MKKILDEKLKITISNQFVNYNRITNKLVHCASIVTKNQKNGFLTFDENGENIGIVFMSDDKRTYRYDNA